MLVWGGSYLDVPNQLVDISFWPFWFSLVFLSGQRLKGHRGHVKNRNNSTGYWKGKTQPQLTCLPEAAQERHTMPILAATLISSGILGGLRQLQPDVCNPIFAEQSGSQERNYLATPSSINRACRPCQSTVQPFFINHVSQTSFLFIADAGHW